MSQDPLGLPPSPNPSGYVKNPLTLADPFGLSPCEWDVTRIDEKYDKHVEGHGKRLGEEPDMPEYKDQHPEDDGFERYRRDAEHLANSPLHEVQREVRRYHDGAILRMDSKGRIVFIQDGKITNYFRPGPDPSPEKFMDNEGTR
ncbi:hypothetical protein GCM10012285_58910 [Streptomyces kronopolitis]|uniref:Uncharacterized protein n=1 Tax=Streptomyces kronopolitis TaxID=1612435 RepID=A0ABQ2JXU9_9ACTN|nr:hypothetical protein GCM10012285_58910 [Streptomyces kronopolitis]